MDGRVRQLLGQRRLLEDAESASKSQVYEVTWLSLGNLFGRFTKEGYAWGPHMRGFYWGPCTGFCRAVLSRNAYLILGAKPESPKQLSCVLFSDSEVRSTGP